MQKTPNGNILSKRDAFLQIVEKESDLPAMASAVARVAQLASSDDQGVQDLTYFVLSDVGLTQKILRLANTVQYRTVSGGTITTISRAIFLLGFDAVKTSALAMMLVERLSNVKHCHAVRAELAKAMYASVIGRELARSSRRPGAEEAAIASLFANIGHVMVAAYDYLHYAEIAALVKSENITEEKAAQRILGCGYDAIAQSILRIWNIPDAIVQAIEPLPVGSLKPAKKSSEWIQQIASFSLEATSLVASSDEAKIAQESSLLLSRFGTALNVDHERLNGLIDSVAVEISILSKIMDVHETADEAPIAEVPKDQPAIPVEFLMSPLHADAGKQQSRHASGKPVQARDMLMEGVQQLLQMTATGNGKLNDVMLLILETLFNSMGFRFAAICLKDAKTEEYRARLTLGEQHAKRKAGFVFATAADNDLFKLAMDSNSDLMISDATDPKIRALLPEWHRSILPDAKSFMILPIVVNHKALGCFYGDRTLPAPEGVPSDETALIKIIKSQMLTALSHK